MQLYTRNQVAGMQPDELIAALDDAEKCLLEIEKVEQEKREKVKTRDQLIADCNDLQRRGAKIPTPVKIAVIPALFLAAQLPGLVQWILIILAIVAVVYYKKYKKARVKEDVELLQTTRIPEYDAAIAKIDRQLEALQPWLRKVQSLMTEDMATLDYVRGIRAQLKQGAPNWFTAMRAYQADLAAQAQAAREEQHRQYMEEQARQNAANSARAAQEAAAARELAAQAERQAAEQAKAAQRPVNPYGCPKCGCDYQILIGYYYDGEPYKYKQCPNCGYNGGTLY